MSQTCEVFIHDSHVLWFQSEAKSAPTVYGRGYAFVNDVFLSGQALVDSLQARFCQENVEDSIAAAKRIVSALSGCWALIVRAADGSVLAAVDRSRSIPLFYAKASDNYILTDTPSAIVGKHIELDIDVVSAAEFLLSAYVSGSRTLYGGVYQVQPGELVEFTTDGCSATHVPHTYFHFFSNDQSTSSREELEEEFERILETTFVRLVACLKEETVVLPLSGGYDSRLIAWMLKMYGIEDVLCYTYGVASSPERVIAERVAKTLGFKWRFIEYDVQRWADCMKSPEMADYWEYAFRGTSSPVLSNFPAVVALGSELDSGGRPIFLPGQVADSWAGCQVLECLEERASYPPGEYHSDYVNILGCPVVSAIAHRHLNLWPVPPRLWNTEPWRSVAQRIRASVLAYENQRGYGIWTHAEWVLRSRLALWLVNGCRCFEYFRGAFMLPLGTNEIIDFLAKLPMRLAIDSEFYVSTLANRILGGPDHPLYGIPVRSSSVHYREAVVKRALLTILLKTRLYKPLDRFRRSFRSPRGLYAESWFAGGRRPESVSIGAALRPYGVAEYLPTEIMHIIQPLLRRPLHSIQSNGLLNAAVLAMEYAKSGDVPCRL